MKYLLFILISITFSETIGGYAGSSFRYGTNAREVSLSNSLVANNNIGFNAFTNPAILPFNKGKYIGSSLFMLSSSRNIQSFTYSQDLPPGAAAAISFFRAGATAVGIDDNEYLTDEIGYSDGYVYDHGTEHGFSGQNFFPEEMKRQNFYRPAARGFEREIAKRMAYWDKLRANSEEDPGR